MHELNKYIRQGYKEDEEEQAPEAEGAVLAAAGHVE